MCHGCVYTGSFELDYPRTLLAALHVHRIEIPYRAFPERVGPRILSLESVDYFATTDHFFGRKKKTRRCGSVYLGAVVIRVREVCYVYEGFVGSAVVLYI